MHRARTTLLTGSPILLIALVVPLILPLPSSAEQTPDQTLKSIASEITSTIERALNLARKAAPQRTAIRQRTRDGALEMMKDVSAMAVELDYLAALIDRAAALYEANR
jgi:hypothetical protein